MGLLRLYSKVTFTKSTKETFIFRNYTAGMEWDGGIEDLTDTFKISFPKAGKWQGKDLFAGSAPIFEVGDQVKVEVGYYPNLYEVFSGWVSSISAKIPVDIQCEDDMWLLKNTNKTYPKKEDINQVYLSKKNGKPRKKPYIVSPNITLKQLLDAILPADIDYTDDTVDVNLGQFRVTNASVAKVLDVLRDKYGLYSYFVDHKLHCGLAYNAATTTNYKYVFEKTLPNAIIDDSNLEYQLSKDISVKVVAKLMGMNNTFEEVTVGDTDGAQRSLHFFWDGVTLPKPDIKKLAEIELTSTRYDGFRGSFTTFGYYPIKPGDIAELSDPTLPERNGKYLVKNVKGSVSMEGYRHEITLGNKVG